MGRNKGRLKVEAHNFARLPNACDFHRHLLNWRTHKRRVEERFGRNAGEADRRRSLF